MHAWIQKVLPEGVQLWRRFFFLMSGERIQTVLKAGHHRSASWRADYGQTLNVGLVALWFFRGSEPVLLRNPIILRFFRGGLNTLSSLCIRAWNVWIFTYPSVKTYLSSIHNIFVIENCKSNVCFKCTLLSGGLHQFRYYYMYYWKLFFFHGPVYWNRC